jgi:hypothetical protein
MIMMYQLPATIRKTPFLRCFLSRNVKKLVDVDATTAGRSPTKQIAVDFASLQVFKALHGHLMVPESFSLSSNIPGTGSQASRLGQHVRHLRHSLHRKDIPENLKEDRMLLSQMGFVWNAHNEKFRRAVEGFVVYRKLHGDYRIKNSFVVPHSDPKWPQTQWGAKLGEQYKNILKADLSSRKVKLLTEHGIPLNGLKSQKAERVLSALHAYKLYANIEPGKEFAVPIKFTVPHNDARWHPSEWGLQLGAAAHNICYYNRYSAYREKFLQVGLRIKNGPATAGREQHTSVYATMDDVVDPLPSKESGYGCKDDGEESDLEHSDEESDTSDEDELEGFSEEDVAARLAARVAATVAKEQSRIENAIAVRERAKARAQAAAVAEEMKAARAAAAEERSRSLAARRAEKAAADAVKLQRRAARKVAMEARKQRAALRLAAKAAAEEARAQREAARAIAAERKAEEEAKYLADIMERAAAARRVMDAVAAPRKRAAAARYGRTIS